MRFFQHLISTILIAVGALTALATPAHAAAGTAGILGVIPGMGHVYNGKPYEGLAWAGSIAALYGASLTKTGKTFTTPSDDPSANWEILPQAAVNLWMYSIYDAYKDAKPKSGRFSDQSLGMNFLENINPLNLWDPVSATLVLGFGGATAYTHRYSGLKDWTRPVFFSVVSVGEEAFSRGFMFPAFSDLFNSRWIGAVFSSAGFVALHVTNGVAEAFEPRIAATRFVFGMILCWQTDRAKYKLGKSIFTHTWYNTLVTPIGDSNGIPTGAALTTQFKF